MRDIILDFETLDTKDTAIVPSIGATVCNLETGEFGERFHVKLDVQEQIDAGFTFSADTLAFWMKQQDAGRNYLIEILDKKTVTVSRKQGFDMLYRFIRNVPNAFVWGNGATFDLGICIREYGQGNLPWQFWGEQDVRSIVSFCKRVFGVEFKKDTKFEGVQHNPVDDANHEAAYLMRYFEHGRNIAQSHALLSSELTDAQFRIAELEAQIAALSTAPMVVSLGDTDELPEAALTDTLSKAEPFKFEVFPGEKLSRTVTALDGTYQSAVRSEGTKEDGYLTAYFFFNHPNDNDLLEEFITSSDHLAGISSTPEEADVVFTCKAMWPRLRKELAQVEATGRTIAPGVIVIVDDDDPKDSATHLPQGCTESSLWNEWRDYFMAAEAVAPVAEDTGTKDEVGEALPPLEPLHVLLLDSNQVVVDTLRKRHGIIAHSSLSKANSQGVKVVAVLKRFESALTEEQGNLADKLGLDVISIKRGDYKPREPIGQTRLYKLVEKARK